MGKVFVFADISTWSWLHLLGWAAVSIGGFELLHVLCLEVPNILTKRLWTMPMRGRHLDKFKTFDWLYIGFNKLYLPVFLFHYCSWSWTSDRVLWKVSELGWLNSVGSLVLFYCIYDLFYSWYHRILHMRGIYRCIHKHHHRQMAPTRGTLDAINEHPFEYLTGEYLHLVSVFLASHLWPCHGFAVAFFIVSVAFLASK